MTIADYFEKTKGTGILATSDADGEVNLAIYARPYVIDENKIAFSMLERRSYKNLQSNSKAAYMFIEQTEGHKGKRLYLVKTGEETDAGLISKIKEQHKKRYSSESAGKHLVYFEITETRQLIGGN
jgi:hypothetical protein